MLLKKIKLNADRLGIITSIACGIHCTVLPLLLSSLPLLNIELLENKFIEWGMIGLSLSFGALSLYHGYIHHHKKPAPAALFSIGFACLILNQVFAEQFILIFIPVSSLCIISAHIFNIYHCRTSGNVRNMGMTTKNVREH